MQIIAHRGASVECPENTLAACERAIAIGVDAIEVDLLLTRDGRMVVRHDDLIQRDGVWMYVQELSFDELRQLDVGSGQRIPSIEELFECVGRRCPLVFDLKTYGLTEPLARFLTAHRAVNQAHVTSFLLSEVDAIGRLLPGVERSFTLAAMPVHFNQLMRDAQTQRISLYRAYLDAATTRHIVEQGIKVSAYPVNLAREAEVFRSWGVDAIYTDDPAVMQSLRGS